MFRWIPYTFVRIVILFIGGIVVGIFFPEIIGKELAIAALVALVSVYCVIWLLNRLLKKSIIEPGLIALPAIFLAGFVHVGLQTEANDAEHLTRVEGKIDAYVAVINSFAEEKTKSWKQYAIVSHVKSDNEWIEVTGKLLMYFPKENFKEPFKYGTQLLIEGQPQEIPGPGNPGEFNYRRFLSYKNIYHQDFIAKGTESVVGTAIANHVMYYSIEARAWASSVIKRYITGSNEQGIAAALILGITDGLDDELLSAYSATGSMHVLAVSGLHVSIIYLLIVLILKPFDKTARGRWIVGIASIFILWGYAFITGLSPSVLRAVTMFTFLTIGKTISRDTNIYNTLAASAFCLLVFDPFLIMSVGFQLSYLAVIGIVYIHPLIFRLYNAETWLGNQTWQITSVSIAAQLATFALGLLYFHQFPNYFLLSNLLIIPVSYGVLIAGLALLAVSALQPIASFVGWITGLLIKLMNAIVNAIDWLPYSLTEGVYITGPGCAAIIAIVVFTVLTLQYKNFRYFRLTAASVLLFVVLQWWNYHQSLSENKFIVYRIPGHSASDIISEGKVFFITDSAFLKEEKKIAFHIRPNRLQSAVGSVHTELLNAASDLPGIFRAGSSTFVYARGPFTLPRPEHIDYLIIGDESISDLSLLSTLHPDTQVILDSSNSYRYVNRFLKASAALKIKVFSVLHQGSFEAVLDQTNELYTL